MLYNKFNIQSVLRISGRKWGEMPREWVTVMPPAKAGRGDKSGL